MKVLFVLQGLAGRTMGNSVHLDCVVPDLDATVRLTARGASLDREIQIREYGRMANMADPFGNGFHLIEFSGSGYDIVSP